MTTYYVLSDGKRIKWIDSLKSNAGQLVGWRERTLHRVGADGRTACGRDIPPVEKVGHGISFYNYSPRLERCICAGCRRRSTP